MAVDIARFLSGIESPVTRVQQGVQFGQQQADRAAAQQAAQAQAEQQRQLQDELLALSQKENRTADDFQDLIIRNPGLAKTFQASIDGLNTQAKTATITEATNVFVALSTGNPDAALKILEDRKEAAENSGDPQEVQKAEVLIQAIKTNPEAALTGAGLFLSSAAGPERFANILKAITPKAKARKTATDVEGRVRFVDSGELAFPSAKAPAKEVFRPATPQELIDLSLPEDTPGVQINTKTNRAFIPGRGISIKVGDRVKGAAAEAATGFLTGVIERGNTANELLNSADLLDLSLDKVAGTLFDTGIFGDIRVGLGRLAILTGRGEGFAESIANAENIDALSQKMTILETQALSGAINKQEFTAAGKINTSLGNTQLGNRFAVKRMRAVGSMNDWMGQRFEELDDANPDATDKKLSRLLKKEFRNIPYVSQKLKDRNGLPLFFTEFRNELIKEQPDISTREMIDQWKAIHR